MASQSRISFTITTRTSRNGHYWLCEEKISNSMIAKIYPDGHPDLKEKKDPTHPVRYFDIRKFTPRECFRLMGVPEHRIDTLLSKDESGRQIISNSACYKLAGNSIVCDVLKYIYETMLYPLQRRLPGEHVDMFGKPQFILPLNGRPLRMVTLCSGYDSQCLAAEMLAAEHPGFSFELMAWSEFDPESKSPLHRQPAVVAHNLLFPQWADRNRGDMTKADWSDLADADIDLLTYSTPCFRAGTLVLTTEGHKPIEDIKVGDMVLTHKGRFRKVTEVGKKPYSGGLRVSIKQTLTKPIECTHNHPFYVRCTDGCEWVEAKNLKEGTLVGLVSQVFKQHIFWIPVDKVEVLTDDAFVYNMSVEEDESYTANGIAVHNCQSISRAGKREGIKRDSGTRSAVLWSTENAVAQMRPKVLLQENVRALIDSTNLPDFKEWCAVLEKHGYANFLPPSFPKEWGTGSRKTVYGILNAKDYGVPQNRERVYMVSVRKDVLGDAQYEFPRPFPIDKCVADILQDEAEQRYFMSPETVIKFLQMNEADKEAGIVYISTDHRLSDEEIADARSSAK